MQIKIVRIPTGEAPEQIRSAWIGIVLPLAANKRLRVATTGVLSGPKTRFGQYFAALFGRMDHTTGYIVNANEAVELLSVHAPEAADWWHQHAPRAVAQGKYLVFDAEACQEMAS